MADRLPSVSVVMPTFNRRRLLPGVVEPLLADDAAAEVIVVVDGCDDGSYEWLVERAGASPQLRPLGIENRGENGARAAGIRAAQGEVVLLLDDDMTGALGRLGLTPARAHVVWLLHHDGPATQRALADALKVTPRNVTGLVDGLVDTGFVTREPHPADRRATLVTLTDHGAATLAQMDRDHRELAALLFGELSPRQLAAFAAGLDHVATRLREAL
jgi:DNA-binding MarR family transcriptional regulator